MRYFSNISTAIKTTFKGMALAINYFFDARKKRKKEWLNDDNYFEKAEGTFTIQYPQESIPVPDHGRYQLHNEINDCIVCDKCSKICPVDCIDIEPVRSPEVFGQTSDGTPLRVHAAKFDIDMAKCCFCGLCTVVCPTECLTMTKEYDFTTTNILDHNFSFSKMSDSEIAEKKKEFEDYQAAKAKPKEALPAVGKKPLGKPTMKPMAKPIMKKGATSLIKPKISSPESKSESEQGPPAKQAVKPVLNPMIKPVIKPKISSPESRSESEQGPPAKQAIKPVIKSPERSDSPEEDTKSSEKTPQRKVNKPIIKPRIQKKN